jgi:hypothetical protein
VSSSSSSPLSAPDIQPLGSFRFRSSALEVIYCTVHWEIHVTRPLHSSLYSCKHLFSRCICSPCRYYVILRRETFLFEFSSQNALALQFQARPSSVHIRLHRPSSSVVWARLLMASTTPTDRHDPRIVRVVLELPTCEHEMVLLATMSCWVVIKMSEAGWQIRPSINQWWHVHRFWKTDIFQTSSSFFIKCFPCIFIRMWITTSNKCTSRIFIIYFNTPTCFGPFGPSSGSYTVKWSSAKTICGFI